MRHLTPAPLRPLAPLLTSAAFLLNLLLVAAGCAEDRAANKPAGEVLSAADSAIGGSDSQPAGDTSLSDAGVIDTTGNATNADVKTSSSDGPCVKECGAKICGPNGCGGVCGFCLSGQFCAADGSKCSEFCKPKCTFASGALKSCGADGCGGDCGTCPADKSCGFDFLCHSKDCKPTCGAKKCGDDGCGATCGACASGDLCQPDGICKPGPCKGIPKEGKCDAGILISCQGEGVTAQKMLLDCATTGPGKICGWDAPQGVNACIDKPPCTPDCSLKDGGKKQCGSDGCDGKCGVCPMGWSCPGGLCEPKDGGDCGFLPAQGKCEGNIWIFCNTGKIKVIDCGKYAQKCAYDGKKFTCK